MRHVTNKAIQNFKEKWGGEELNRFFAYDDVLETVIAIMGVYRAMTSSGSSHEEAFSIAWSVINENIDLDIFGGQSNTLYSDLSDLLQNSFDFNSLCETSEDIDVEDEDDEAELIRSIEKSQQERLKILSLFTN